LNGTGSADALVRKRVRSTRKPEENWRRDLLFALRAQCGRGRAPSVWPHYSASFWTQLLRGNL